MIESTQEDFITELKYITDALYSAVFTLQCLYAYGSGQIPMLKSCPKALAESCWKNTQNILNQDLMDLTRIIRLMETSMDQPPVVPA